MSHLNKIILLGNIGQTPTTTPGGYAKFSIATSETYKDKHGKFNKTTQWHNIIVFNEHLSRYAINNFEKGMLIYVEGKITYREVVTDDGKKKKFVDVVVGKQGGEIKIMHRPTPKD